MKIEQNAPPVEGRASLRVEKQVSLADYFHKCRCAVVFGYRSNGENRVVQVRHFVRETLLPVKDSDAL
jgi:hypothetical protein